MIKDEFVLAPLDKVNCSSFRILCKKCGADIVSTPMINTNGFINNNKKFYYNKIEKPLMIQFIGSNVSEFKECMNNIDGYNFVDLNAGCPSLDQTSNGSGSALLKNIPLLKKIVTTMVKYSPIPVSVKIRMGWDKDESVKIGKAIESCGASFLTIHPRTKFDNYGTRAKWEVIKKLKRKIKIPVIANGDLLNPQAVSDCINFTLCDSVMIGRAAMSNPFIFKDSKDFIETGILNTHSKNEKIELIQEFIKLYNKYDKKNYNFSELRNHCVWLIKEFEHATVLRNLVGRCKTEKEIEDLLKNHLDS